MNKTQIMTRNVLCVLLLCNIIFAIVPFVLPVYFDAHDDSLMLLFASGAYTGTPETHLVYNHIFYGEFLAFLYRITGKIEWYTLVQYGLQVVSFNVFLYHILCLDTKKLYKYLYSAVIMLIAVGQLIRPQYTFVASELSLASIVVIYGKRNIWCCVFSGLLFVSACLLRITAACIPYFIILPLLVFPVLFREKYYQKKIIFLSSLVIIAVCLYVIDKHAYTSDSKWKYFAEYNTERQYIIDNPSKGSYVFKDKVKEQEYRLIVEKHIFEGNILSAKDLDDVVANLSNRTFRNIFSNIYPYGRDYKLSGLLVLCILLGIPCLLYYIKKDWIFVLCLCLFVLANMFCMHRSSSKIYLSMALSIPILFVFLVDTYQKVWRSRKWNIILILPMIIYLGGYRLFFLIDWNKREIESYKPLKEIVKGVECKKMAYIDTAFGGELAFHTSQSRQGRIFLRQAWATNSPYNNMFYAGFKSYVDNMPLLLRTKNMNVIPKIQEILLDHYHVKTKVIIWKSNNQWTIFKLKSI